MSLIERKKQQWAKEREELASLGAPWGPTTHQSFERNKYDFKAPMVNIALYKRNGSTVRRGSLPPLHKNQYNSYDKEVGGETSGYGSENNNNKTPDCGQNWNQSGYESSSSRDDRPKWGDKGVGVGKFWRHKEEILENVAATEPPNWVRRGLEDGEILVSNTSPSESPEQRYEDQERPYTGSSYSCNRMTYIRGQNIPIDSVELAERERKRQMALAHQEAIRQQLQDKERKRLEERERRIREEREEELRIEREQEAERLRKEEEIKQQMEKQERERKRKEAIQEAIELAQKEAQLEKMKKRNNNMNISQNNSEKDKMSVNTTKECVNISENLNKVEEKKVNCEPLNNTKTTHPKTETLDNEINNNLEIRGKSITPRNNAEHVTDNHIEPAREHLNNNATVLHNILPNSIPTPRLDNVALILPTPLDALPNIQYALLIPATPQNMPMAVPFNIPQTARTLSTARTENRILTPTQYRNRNVMLSDSCTQTEESAFASSAENSSEARERYVKEKLTNLELAYDNRRKERRSRSESLEERPKWGVNRPPTRYMKQSEKDPLYQRRKLRQKMRETKGYDEKNSSDESQTASPIGYRRRGYSSEKRTTRALWRKHDQMFTRNIRMYQTQLIPLDSDRDQLYYRENECCCVCRCGRHRCSDIGGNLDILKIEHNSPREVADKLPDVQVANKDILDKLSALQNGLLVKQEQWDTMPSTPSLSSAKSSKQ